MAKVVAIHAIKGGVGKSSLSVNLAHALAQAGRRVLLWDLDAQGGATFLLGMTPGGKAKHAFTRRTDPADLVQHTAYPGLDLIAADMSLRQLDHDLAEADRPKLLKKLIGQLADGYERIVLDCPPGLGALSDQLLRAVDLVVVPLVPAPLALRTLEQSNAHRAAGETAGRPAPPLLPVFSMVDRRKSLHRDMTAAEPDWPAIPQASVIERMAVAQAPLATFAGRSSAAQAVGAVADAVERALA